MSGWIENGWLLVREIRKQSRAVRNNITTCQVCLLDSERVATEMNGHLSSMGRHSILCNHEIPSRIATALLMSFEWSLRRTLSLWSNSRQMTPLAIRPIERCGVSRNAVLQPLVSATVCNKKQGDMLTSQTTTVLGAHLTRTWKSWPRAIWSYRNFNRKSLSSCLYPMMWRVTITLVSIALRQGKMYDLHCGFTKIAFSPVACE